MKLSVLDVGHGNSTVIRDSDWVVVVDAGAGTALEEFLLQEKIEEIDIVIISHSDWDHVDGLIRLLVTKTVSIKKVFLNPDAAKKTDNWADLLWEIKEAQIELRTSVTRGDYWESGHGTKVEVLAPSSYIASIGVGSTDRDGRQLRAHSLSVVIRVVQHESPIALLPGDLDGIGLSHIRNDVVDCAAQVLVFPHHGGKPGTSTVEEFVGNLCAIVNPNRVIFSNGRKKMGFPRPDIVARIMTSCPNVRISCTQLASECAQDLPLGKASHLGGSFSAGHELGMCCAGTVELSMFNGSLSALPTDGLHDQFIQRISGKPICKR